MPGILAEAALRTALLAGAVQCTLWLLRIRQPRLLLAAWTIVLGASILMPVLARIAPLSVPLDLALPQALLLQGLIPQGLIPQGLIAPELIPPALKPHAIQHLEMLHQAMQPLLQKAQGDAALEVRPQPSIVAWLQIVYALVACGIGLRVMLGLVLSLRILARATPVRVGWADGLRVRTSRDVAGPVTIARTIVIPIDAVGWSAETRRAVLAHEGAHVARRDFAMLVASQLNRAVFWFSPLSWWLHRRLVALTELASDDQAIAATRDRLAYAETLLEMGRRVGPVPHAPAMARRSTLPYRIERILRDQTIPGEDAASHRIWLTAGMAGLAIAVAGLTPGSAPTPAPAPLPGHLAATVEPAVQPMPQDADPAPVATPTTLASQVPQRPAERPAPEPTQTAGPTPPRRPAMPLQSAALPAAPARPARPMPPPPSRRDLRTQLKGVATPSPVKQTETPAQSAATPRPNGAEPALQKPVPAAMPVQMVAFELAAKSGSLTDDEGRWSLPQQIAYGSLAFAPHADLDGLVGNTCQGTLLVGAGASANAGPTQPVIQPGQRIPLQAQFFRRQGGITWVRFNVFDRPSLDLPVRMARSGITWTGEYGISYAVQWAGPSRLVGLAARVANDSARLEFACGKSATHLF